MLMSRSEQPIGPPPFRLTLTPADRASARASSDPPPPPVLPPRRQPGGMESPPLTRGVYWAPYTVEGQWVCLAVDSRHDVGSRWQIVAPTVDRVAVERALAERLDRDDPPLALVR